jgi:hypothetical protein
MCWPHWRRVPKQRAQFSIRAEVAQTKNMTQAVVAEAISVVVAKENGWEYNL